MSGITSADKALLDQYMNVSTKVKLGTLLDAATGSHKAVYAGEFTTAGGDAAELISIPGVLATDIVLMSVHTAGGTPRSIVAASADADEINVTMSGDPSTDHVLSYMVLRAV